MKILVLGATGNVGARVVKEARVRGHEVTAGGRSAQRLNELDGVASASVVDVSDALEVAHLCRGQDVVVNATRPASGHEHEIGVLTRGLLAGVAKSDARLLVVGGAASLLVPGSGGKTVLEDSRFLKPALRHIGRASFEQYEIFQQSKQRDWTYLSPPAELLAGERTTRYRDGRDELLVDSQGRSHISLEDLAVALLDEIETPRYRQQRFTVAY